MSSPDLVTFGETMVVVRSQNPGPLQHNEALQLSCAGAESNVAIGLARLGHDAVWVGRTGDDEAGELVRTSLRGAGVAVTGPVDPARPTGLLLRSARTSDLQRVYYYRRGSAGAALTIENLKESLVRRPRMLHATGITPALSPEAHRATIDAMSLAREMGTTVSYDVNFRSRLTTVDDAAAVLRQTFDAVDILFCGEDEVPVVTTALGCSTLDAAVAAVGPDLEIVVKQGRRGARVHTAGSSVFQPAVDVPAVDVVGAGDAFVSGYLSARLDGLGVADRLARGVLLGAFCVCAYGDWEGLPTRAELGLLDTPPDFTDR